MDKLYPIIRRKRRPLIQENPEPAKAEIVKPVAVPQAPPEQPKTPDAKLPATNDSE
jgi:hypothetical protein